MKVENFIVGQQYDIHYVVKNIGEKKSPFGRIYIDIKWPETKAETTWEFTAKPLEPGDCDISETKTYLALSTGLATITAYKRIKSGLEDLQNVVELNVYRKDGKKKLGKKEAFDTIYATTPEAVYTYWGFWVATAGLLIIASEKLWKVLLFFLSLDC